MEWVRLYFPLVKSLLRAAQEWEGEEWRSYLFEGFAHKFKIA